MVHAGSCGHCCCAAAMLEVYLQFCSSLHVQLYRILERHLISTGAALVAMQRGSEHAGESPLAAQFDRTEVAVLAPGDQDGITTAMWRVTRRAMM
jgi:hypothetical protein